MKRTKTAKRRKLIYAKKLSAAEKKRVRVILPSSLLLAGIAGIGFAPFYGKELARAYRKFFAKGKDVSNWLNRSEAKSEALQALTGLSLASSVAGYHGYNVARALTGRTLKVRKDVTKKAPKAIAASLAAAALLGLGAKYGKNRYILRKMRQAGRTLLRRRPPFEDISARLPMARRLLTK